MSAYTEQVTIDLPNGEQVPALVEIRGDHHGIWTRITPQDA